MQNPQLKAADVLRKLNNKFSSNLANALPVISAELKQIDLTARALAESGKLLQETKNLTSTQVEICAITEEVFADVITSVYLSVVGLNVPAQMALRRAFELGVALVYLWDLPHVFWGWKECDIDLNFSDMLNHMSRADYLAYLRRTEGYDHTPTLIDVVKARKIYGSTSDTVHGKITTHKVQAGDGYELNLQDCRVHFSLVADMTGIVLRLWTIRFPVLKDGLHQRLPASQTLI